jgi:hypothetical protein
VILGADALGTALCQQGKNPQEDLEGTHDGHVRFVMLESLER